MSTGPRLWNGRTSWAQSEHTYTNDLGERIEAYGVGKIVAWKGSQLIGEFPTMVLAVAALEGCR